MINESSLKHCDDYLSDDNGSYKNLGTQGCVYRREYDHGDDKITRIGAEVRLLKRDVINLPSNSYILW